LDLVVDWLLGLFLESFYYVYCLVVTTMDGDYVHSRFVDISRFQPHKY